jgi:hypothetical protein
LVLCFFEIHTLQTIQQTGLSREVVGASGLLRGTPELRAFQNRVLGPLIVYGITKSTGQSYAQSYVAVVSLLIALANFVCCYLVYRVTRNAVTALGATLAFVIATIFLQDDSWFFLWDAIDLTIMLVFAYAVFHPRSDLKLLYPLFAIELLNRESAGFIALWIIFSAIGPLIYSRTTPARRKAQINMAVIGAGLLAFGVIWTHALRKLFFRHSFDPKINLDLTHGSDGQWFELFYNLRFHTLQQSMTGYVTALICCLALGFLVYRLFKIRGDEAYPVALLIGAMVSCIWIFGRVVETRVWLDFVPLGIFYLFTVENFESQTSSITAPKTHQSRAA